MKLETETLLENLDDLLVPLTFDGDKTPLVLVHPIAGTITGYVALSQLIEDRPVYGIEAPAALLAESGMSFEKLAATYLQGIERTLGASAFQLGGWSLGGVVAYEMSQQLRSAGRDVGPLVMIDSFIPEKMAEGQRRGSAFWFLKDVEAMCKTTFEVTLEEAKTLPSQDLIAKVMKAVEALPSANQARTSALVRTLVGSYFALRDLANRYQPKAFAGKAVLLQAAESLDSPPLNTELNGWQKLIASLTVRQVPGNHFSMTKPPQVETLAEALKTALNA